MMADNRTIIMLKRVSRLLNGATGGSFAEMFCSRVWTRNQGRGILVRLLDAAALILWGERDHCKNAALAEYMRQGGIGEIDRTPSPYWRNRSEEDNQ